jgi:ribosome-binding protein aMBF1 (putative translation factor)
MERKRKPISAREAIHRALYEGRPNRIAERDQTHREMALGLKIRHYREEAGLTQQELADKIGTQPSAISRIEDADYDGHSMDTLQKVADALDMLLIVDLEPKHHSPRRKAREV